MSSWRSQPSLLHWSTKNGRVEAPEADAEGDGGSEGEQEMPPRFNLRILQHSAPRAPGWAVPHHLQAEEASRWAGHQLSLFPKAPL